MDTKVCAGFNADTPRVLGWDAGALVRPGSSSEFQLVDERIVTRKPRSMDNATADRCSRSAGQASAD